MKIHDVISIAHLEPATDSTEDPYQRRRPLAPAVVVDGEEEYEVKKLLRKPRIQRERGWSTQYLVRWLTYELESDTWESDYELLQNARERVEEYESANANIAIQALLCVDAS